MSKMLSTSTFSPDFSQVPFDLINNLSAFGYHWIQTPTSELTFTHLATGLGKIVASYDVAMKPGGPMVNSPGAIPFHTDGEEADIVAWRCVDSDPTCGNMNLVDTADLSYYLTEEEYDGLSRIFSGPPDSCPQLQPIVTRDAYGTRVTCTPWNITTPSDPALLSVLKKFRNYLQHKTKRPDLSIRLEKGQCLFIDNRRMLHGREAIPPNTSRRMTRFWIARV